MDVSGCCTMEVSHRLPLVCGLSGIPKVAKSNICRYLKEALRSAEIGGEIQRMPESLNFERQTNCYLFASARAMAQSGFGDTDDPTRENTCHLGRRERETTASQISFSLSQIKEHFPRNQAKFGELIDFGQRKAAKRWFEEVPILNANIADPRQN